MPWMTVKKDDQVCVYKKGADGNAEGDSLHCYKGDDAEEKAKDYMRALYANSNDMQSHNAFMDKVHKLLKFIGVNLEGESLDEKMRVISDSFYKAFERSSEPVYAPYIEKYYDSYVICREGEKLYKVEFSVDDAGNITFQPRAEWKTVKHTESYVEMRQAFSFTELTDLASSKVIDGLAASDDHPFTSMHGEEVYILTGDLEAYMENTLPVIESTRSESGEIVGLPIDLEGHNHKGGAGWIVGLKLDKIRNVIRLLVNWTEKGAEQIKGNLSRFFSPSVDTEAKIILGGSLTNWPASRNAKGRYLLRPIELSQSIKEIDMEKTLLEMLAELPGKVAEAVRGKQQETPTTIAPTELETEISPQIKQFLQDPEGVEELGKQAQELARNAIHLEKRKAHTVKFASKLAGGTAEHPVGLKVRPNELVACLLSLPEKQALYIEKILSDALDGAINFSMRGLDGDGFIQKPELPREVQGYLRTWVDAGKSVGEFFQINLELGNPEDYNLKEFARKEA